LFCVETPTQTNARMQPNNKQSKDKIPNPKETLTINIKSTTKFI